MGKANRRLITTEFNTRSVGKKYTNFFKEIIALK